MEEIRNRFAKMKSKKDLAELLTFAKKILYGENSKPISLYSLTYYSNPKLCKKRYVTFNIKKKSGELRTIHAPVKGLKIILRCLNFVFQCVFEPINAVKGFVKGRSIIDNALEHVNSPYILNLDLKDFFYSFERKRVKYALTCAPFYLRGKREPLAFLLASLCTHPIEIDGKEKIVLPQGSPTSPTLTNIICKNLDKRLFELCKRYGANYTRYADDITFSAYENIFDTEEAEFFSELTQIIEKKNFEINHKKVRLQKGYKRQEVTGLIVNTKVNVKRKFIKQIRMYLYYWERYGYEKAEKIFKKDYNKIKNNNTNANLEKVLEGKLNFVKQVKGECDSTYIKLASRFYKLKLNELIKKNNKETTKLENLLNTLETKGFKDFKELYKTNKIDNK